MGPDNPRRHEETEILIVEDSPTQAEELKYIIEKRRYPVSVANNGIAALELMKKRKPAIVISDIMMPGMDGYELCRRIKADNILRDTPIILLTSLSDSKDILKGLESGAENFITKPYQEDHLISRIENLLLNKELRRGESIQQVLEFYFGGMKHYITADRMQILNLLLSTYEAAVEKSLGLIKVQEELKVLNEELVRTAEEAVSASRAKSEFVSMMNHELRTPLNSVLGFAQILDAEFYGKLNEKQKEYVKDILGSGEHLLALINDILDMSKIEAGKIELKAAKVNLPDFFNKVLTSMTAKAKEFKIDCELKSSPGLPKEIMADELRLKQVLLNFLSNAFKFTPAGGKVVIDGKKISDSEIEISVTDDGSGIKKEDQEKLFAPFVQLENHKKGGTGLGLSLSKKIVTLWGGRIGVVSPPEGKKTGSRFYFTIPVR